MSITLEVDEQALHALPLGPGERERHMQIELACRYYAKGWLSYGQAARMAALEQFTFAGELAERGIPRNYSVQDALEDIAEAKTQLSKLIAAAERGEEVIIARRDKPVVRLDIVRENHGKSRIGGLKGRKFKMGAKFDDPAHNREIARSFNLP